METLVVETNSIEQSKTVKAILKALNVRFKALKVDAGSERIAEMVVQGYRESMDIEAGKIKPKTLDELLDEL